MKRRLWSTVSGKKSVLNVYLGILRGFRDRSRKFHESCGVSEEVVCDETAFSMRDKPKKRQLRIVRRGGLSDFHFDLLQE